MSQALHDLNQSKTTTKSEFLTFFLDNEEYAIKIENVREILGLIDITTIPNIPAYIKGVLNLRDKNISVIDLRLKLNMDFKEYDDRTSIIIIEISANSRQLLIGAVVDMVSKVIQINDEDYDETPYFGVDVNTGIIQGMDKEKVRVLSDIEKVLTTDDLNVIANIAKSTEYQTYN